MQGQNGEATVNIWGKTSRRVAWSSLTSAALLAFTADRLSKRLLVPAIIPNEGDSVPVVGSWLRLTHAHNTGVAFGLFTDRNLLFSLLAVAVLVIIVQFYRQLPGDLVWLRISLGLQVGGATGNLLDRVTQGYVTDFIQVPYWPVFNVGDSCICVGVLMLAIFLIVAPEAAQQEQGGTPHGSRRVSHHPRVSD